VLNKKQQAFVSEYLKDQNATQAAIRAGYPAKNAASSAIQVLKSINVQNAIQGAIDKKAEEIGLTVERLLEEEKCISFSNVQEYFDHNIMKKPSEWPENIARAVQSYEVTDTLAGPKVKIKLWDKGASLDRLEKYMGMFKDKGDRPQIIILGSDDMDKPENSGLSGNVE
jgi:phage terminase small subunit